MFGNQQQQDERPSSPPWLRAPAARTPAGQHDPGEAPSAKPSWRQGTPPASPPPKVLSPSAAQQRHGLQRTPPATPGSRLGNHLSPGLSPAAGKRTPSASASQQHTPVPSPGRLPSAAAVATVAALGGSPGRRRAKQSPRPALHLLFSAPQEQQEGQQGSTAASPARLPAAPAAAAPTPLSKLVQEASPARLAHRGSPVGAGDFRIRAGPAAQGQGLQRQRGLSLALPAADLEGVQEGAARPSAEGSEEVSQPDSWDTSISVHACCNLLRRSTWLRSALTIRLPGISPGHLWCSKCSSPRDQPKGCSILVIILLPTHRPTICRTPSSPQPPAALLPRQ